MVFILLGLSVYWATKILQTAIDLRTGYAKLVWLCIIVGISALGLWIAGENPAWCLAVATIAGLTERTDHILGAVRDWIRVQVLRGPPRR